MAVVESGNWRVEGGSVANGSTKTFSSTATYSIPAGATFQGMKVINPNGNNSTYLHMSGAAETLWGQRGWNTYKTDVPSSIWANGTTVSINITNGYHQGGSSIAMTLYVGWKWKTNKVTAGHTIYATDRSQTGTSTTQGAVIKDSHWSAGTTATASAFNSTYSLT